MSTVFVVGSLNIDQNIRVRSLPRAGETVRGSDATFSPGGKGGNQAVAAARAGATVKFTGAVGDDAHGRRILEVLSEARIDTGHVRVSGTTATGTAIIAVDDQGENQIIVSPGANSGLTAADVEAGLAAVRAGDVLVLQLEIQAALVRQAARTAKSRGAFVILNAAPAPRQIDGLLDDVDLLVVNEQEIQVRRPSRPRRDTGKPPGPGPDAAARPGSGHRLHCRRGRVLHGPRWQPCARAGGQGRRQGHHGSRRHLRGLPRRIPCRQPPRPAFRDDPRHPRFGSRSHAHRRNGIDSMAP